MLGIIIFQFQWWLCVLHNHAYLHYGYILAFISALLALFLKHYPSHFYKKILFVTGLASIGIANDMLLAFFKIFEFPDLWLATLWFCFAAWFFEAAWINQKRLLCAIAFMIAGPLSYLAGAKLGGLVFLQFTPEIFILLALDWFVLGLVFVQTYFFCFAREG